MQNVNIRIKNLPSYPVQLARVKLYSHKQKKSKNFVVFVNFVLVLADLYISFCYLSIFFPKVYLKVLCKTFLHSFSFISCKIS